MITTPKSLRAIGFVKAAPTPYRCVSPVCRKFAVDNPSYQRMIHYIHSPLDKCSRCGETMYWYPLATIHLIQHEKRGIIVEKSFDQGMIIPTGQKLEFLCEKSRKGYREQAKSPNQPRHYTENPEAATCYECLKAFNKDHHPLQLLAEGF